MWSKIKRRKMNSLRGLSVLKKCSAAKISSALMSIETVIIVKDAGCAQTRQCSMINQVKGARALAIGATLGFKLPCANAFHRWIDDLMYRTCESLRLEISEQG